MEVDGQGSSTECGRSSAPCLLQIPNTGSRDVTGQLEAERSRAIVNVIGEVAFLYAGCIAHVAYLRVPSSSPSVSRRFGDLHGPGIALPCAQRVAQQFLNFLPRSEERRVVQEC